jgi:hypothetical protein
MEEEASSVGTGVGRIIPDPVTRDAAGNIYAPDVHESAYEAVVSGSGAIAMGSGVIAAGAGGVAIIGPENWTTC